MKVRIIEFLCGIGLIGFVVLCGASSTQAAASYNPNNIIRDDIFVNSGTMSQQDIQNFLTSNNSCLASVDPSELGGSGQTAAQIIYTAATTVGINPRVILTTLQKEQSLIGSTCAQIEASQGRTYAITRALGYNVPDVLGVGSCLYSFYAQLMGNTCGSDHYLGGPGSMRGAYDRNQVGPGGSYAFPASFTVQEYSTKAGNIVITPQSRATAMLFRYTPYAYYGNYNFFTIFQNYFGNPAYGSNLMVIKVDGEPESSVVYNGVRHPIYSLEALNAWGLNALPVSTVTSEIYRSYPVGEGITRVFKEIDGPRVFVAQGGTARHISTSSFVQRFGLSNEPVSTLPQGLIFSGLREGNPAGFLVQAEGRSEVYLSLAAGKYYIPSIPVIEAWGFLYSELVKVSASDLEALPTAGNLSVLVKGSGPEIYVASLRNFVYAPSPSRLADWNMQSLGLTIIDDAYLQSLPKLGALSRLTRGTGPDTYYIENKKRYYVKNLSTSISYEKQYGKLTPMADTTISSIPYAGIK